jgi:tetratricopeptide (TPR) repeat protein
VLRGGEHRRAHTRASSALELARRSGSVVAIAHARATLAAIALAVAEPDTALAYARPALRSQRRVGQRLAEARSLRILAEAYGRLGDTRAAEACAGQAAALAERVRLS